MSVVVSVVVSLWCLLFKRLMNLTNHFLINPLSPLPSPPFPPPYLPRTTPRQPKLILFTMNKLIVQGGDVGDDGYTKLERQQMVNLSDLNARLDKVKF